MHMNTYITTDTHAVYTEQDWGILGGLASS